MERPHRTLLPPAAVAAALLLAACGDDGAAGPAGGAASADADVTVVAEDVDFGADAYEAQAGDVAFEYVNEGIIEHTLVIEGVDDFRLLVETRGDTDQGTAALEPGSYRLICDIPGHAQAGMVADLDVG